MAKWEYTLKNSKALRSAIDEEDYYGIVEALKDSYTEIHQALPDVYDEDDLERDIEELDILLENLEDSDGGAEDEVDYALNEFYDLCDNIRVWVEIY